MRLRVEAWKHDLLGERSSEICPEAVCAERRLARQRLLFRFQLWRFSYRTQSLFPVTGKL